jgi:hypothetical protein
VPYACPERQRAAHNEAVKRWRQKSAKRYAAQQAVKKALANGALVRWPGCAACPRKRGLEAHHYDYDQPLCVTWLCMKCHKAAHAIVGFRDTDPHARQHRDMPPLSGYVGRSRLCAIRSDYEPATQTRLAHLSAMRSRCGPVAQAKEET